MLPIRFGCARTYKMLLKEIKNIYHRELDSIYPKDEVDSLFSLTLTHYLKLDRFILAFQPELVISKEEEQPLFETLASLKQHVPIQYILGESLFMDIPLKVGRGVLIPRPETEDLVRWVLADITDDKKITCLDVGTGSGAIAIALKKSRPEITMYALDNSKRALEICEENALTHEVELQLLEFDIAGDWKRNQWHQMYWIMNLLRHYLFQMMILCVTMMPF